MRYSEYRIRGHGRGGGKSGDSAKPDSLSAPVGVVNDEGVTRYRPKIVLADHHIDTSGATQRGLREMRRAVARSSRFTAVVRTWFRSDGTLWDLNLLTRVTASRFGVDQRDLLICQVEFSLDAQRRNHPADSCPRDGFIVPAEPDSKGLGGNDAGGVDAFIHQQMKKQGITFNDK